ncbi:MAG: substrate-binding domain-containing protein [Anaerolineales bacterium]
MRALPRLLALVLALLTCGCQTLLTPLDEQLPVAAPLADEAAEQLVSLAACWEAEPLAGLLRVGYEGQHGDATVLVTLTDSAQVVAMLESGQASLGLVVAPVDTRPTLPEGWAAYALALDGLALVASPEVALPSISTVDLARLYAGRVFSWSELIADADESTGVPIVVTRESGAVLRQVFEEGVMGGQPISTVAVVQATTQATLDYLATTPGALGYVPAAQVDDRVRVVALDDRLPTPSQLKRGRYPLRFALWLVLPVSLDGLADANALQLATYALGARGSRAIDAAYARP